MTNQSEIRHKEMLGEIHSICEEMKKRLDMLKVDYKPPKKPCGGCKTKRKPIHIAMNMDDCNDPVLMVVCDDGSIWSGEIPLGKVSVAWNRLSDIPQDE